MRGVDVSIFNENVDWQALKAAGIEFAICRTGYGRTDADESFQRHVEGAHKAGIICGAYHYSYALTPSAATQEAQFCKQLIEQAGVLLELPVWFYMEDSDGYKKRHSFEFSRRNVTNICKAFLDSIKPLNCGVYSSYSWLEEMIDWQSLGCEIWSAQWSKEDSFKGRMWQFTDALKIDGQNFNGNILYDKNEQAVLGESTATPQQATAPQSTSDLIHNILSSHSKEETTAAPVQPATPKPQANSDVVSNILSNIKPQGSSTTAAQAPTPAQAEKPQDSSANNIIHNILSNVKKNK